MTQVNKVISRWPENPRETAAQLIERYGPPDDISASRLLWLNTDDGWKRTVISSAEVPHNFPAPHTDFLEQTIDYRVPPAMYTLLAEFDGSLIAKRTSGELTAQCPDPAINFSIINLAHDIIARARSVSSARDEHTRLCEMFNRGERPPYALAFQFDLPTEDTKDADHKTVEWT